MTPGPGSGSFGMVVPDPAAPADSVTLTEGGPMMSTVSGRVALVTGVLVAATSLLAAPGAVASGSARPAAAPTARAGAGFTVFPVPTTGAGLGRITTAPNGDLWFVERDVNQVGVITPAGDITEFSLPDVVSPDVAQVKDLEVAPDGRVWVIYDTGNSVVGLEPDGTVSEGPYSLGGFPYGEEVRADDTGKVWLSNNYDIAFLAWIVFGNDAFSSANAPECDGALGAGADSQMWCASTPGASSKLIRVDADGNGGVTFPVPQLPSAAFSTIYTLTPGPVGAIWFGRDDGGTIFTSRNDGSIGYLTHNGNATLIDTGQRTAPHSLVEGPDGAMWFTNWGADPAIGHYDPVNGRGALSSVGAYAPDWLTFDDDGFIWATDSANNSVLRIDPATLGLTDVDPGAGSVLNDYPVGKQVVPRAPLAVKKNAVKVSVSCPVSATAGCRGTVILRGTQGKHPAITRRATFDVDPGTSGSGKLALTPAGKQLLPKGKAVKVRFEVAPTWTTKASRTVIVKVRR